MLISRQDKLAARKSAHQHQQTRLRQVKIGQHRIRPLKLEPGPNEKIRLARSSQKQALHRANTRGPGADHPIRPAYPGFVFRRHMEFLRVQRLTPHRLKRPQPDVERNISDFRSPRSAHVQNLASEVQPCRRRSHRTCFMREDSLIPFPILDRIPALDIRRQRNMPDPFQPHMHIAIQVKPHRPLPKTSAPDDLRLHPIHADSLPYAHLAARMHQRSPGFFILGHRRDQKNLHLSRQILRSLRIVLPNRQRIHARAMSK